VIDVPHAIRRQELTESDVQKSMRSPVEVDALDLDASPAERPPEVIVIGGGRGGERAVDEAGLSAVGQVQKPNLRQRAE
jgi:hypothetical protein